VHICLLSPSCLKMKTINAVVIEINSNFKYMCTDSLFFISRGSVKCCCLMGKYAVSGVGVKKNNSTKAMIRNA